MPIPEIFSRRGELWFRRTEEAAIREVLAGEPPGRAGAGRRRAGERPHPRPAGRRRPRRVAARERGRGLGAGEGLGPAAGRRTATASRGGRRPREPNYREAADLEVDADGPAEEVAARVAAWAQRGAAGAAR